jgi:hypothetical protein
LAISNNGLLFSGVGSTQFVNQPIKQSSAVHGFVAPFWDDLVTWGTAGSVYYKTLGIEPNRKFVVEWKDNQHYHDSTEGITFEAILYEGSNNIQFQYLDTNFGTVTGSTSSDLSPYDNGGSATIGIESPDGNDGLQYSYNEQVINPELAILYKFPQFAGTNLYLSKQPLQAKTVGAQWSTPCTTITSETRAPKMLCSQIHYPTKLNTFQVRMEGAMTPEQKR